MSNSANSESTAELLDLVGRSTAYLVGGVGVLTSVTLLTLPVAHGTAPESADVFRAVAYLVGRERAGPEFFRHGLTMLGSVAVVYAVRYRRQSLLYVVTGTFALTTRGRLRLPVEDITPLYDLWVTLELYRLLPGGRYDAVAELPFAVPLVCSVVCLAVAGWVAGDRTESGSTVETPSGRRRHWYWLAAVAGYVVVAVGLSVAADTLTPFEVSSHPAVTLTERVRRAAGVILVVALVADSVHRRAVRPLVVLAAGAWVTGVAALQYDGALPGVALPAAVLLTLAAVGLWLDGR